MRCWHRQPLLRILCCLGAVAWLLVHAPSGPAMSAETDVGKLEARVVELTNAERLRHGLPAVEAEPRLGQAAREHSLEMATLGYFSHESPTPGRRTVNERLRRAGLAFTSAGENIACYSGHPAEKAAERVVADWMDSPGHRQNILHPGFTRIGLGMAIQGRSIYFTQELATFRGDRGSSKAPVRVHVPILIP